MGGARLTSADTIVASLASPQSLNRYSYVSNNPINNTDPTGHQECDFFDGSGGCHKGPSPAPAPKPTGTNGSSSPAAGATSAADTAGDENKGSSGPEAKDPSREVKIQVLIDAHRYQEAISLATELYGLNIRMPKRGVRFNPDIEGERRTDMHGNIDIGLDAFQSPGWLASSIGHENVRVNQLAEDRWGRDSKGGIVNEVEAYDWEIQNANTNGLTSSEKQDLTNRRYTYLYALPLSDLEVSAISLRQYNSVQYNRYWYSIQVTVPGLGLEP